MQIGHSYSTFSRHWVKRFRPLVCTKSSPGTLRRSGKRLRHASLPATEGHISLRCPIASVRAGVQAPFRHGTSRLRHRHTSDWRGTGRSRRPYPTRRREGWQEKKLGSPHGHRKPHDGIGQRQDGQDLDGGGAASRERWLSSPTGSCTGSGGAPCTAGRP